MWGQWAGVWYGIRFPKSRMPYIRYILEAVYTAVVVCAYGTGSFCRITVYRIYDRIYDRIYGPYIRGYMTVLSLYPTALCLYNSYDLQYVGLYTYRCSTDLVPGCLYAHSVLIQYTAYGSGDQKSRISYLRSYIRYIRPKLGRMPYIRGNGQKGRISYARTVAVPDH